MNHLNHLTVTGTLLEAPVFTIPPDGRPLLLLHLAIDHNPSLRKTPQGFLHCVYTGPHAEALAAILQPGDTIFADGTLILGASINVAGQSVANWIECYHCAGGFPEDAA